MNNMINNIKFGAKLTFAFGILVLASIVIGAMGYNSVDSMRDLVNIIFDHHLAAINQDLEINVNVTDTSGKVYKYFVLPAARETLRGDLKGINESVIADVAKIRKESLPKNKNDAIKGFESDWNAYYAEINTTLQLIDENKLDEVRNTINKGGAFATKRVTAEDDIAVVVKIDQDIASLEKTNAETLRVNTQIAIIIVIIIATLIGILVALLVTRSILTPLKVLTVTAYKFSQGDLNRDLPDATRNSIVNRKDELGRVGEGFFETGKYLSDVAEAVQRVAAGDLALEFKVRGKQDELGITFETMIQKLKGLVGQIGENTSSLSGASMQLAEVADQAGRSTNQISATIQQVAR